jgi:three-Cys-motif partner protein
MIDRCQACGEPLDRNSLECRVCGEDNSPDAAPEIMPSAPEAFRAPVFYDQLGDWSQIKHDILCDYASAYTRIIKNQNARFETVYIDGFAGAGVAVDRDSGDLVGGSPYRMLFDVEPPFDRYHFLELDPQKVASLRSWFGSNQRVRIHQGDANDLLVNEILPTCQWKDYVRALCLLDPYGLSVPWSVMTEIAKTRTTEIFFNFMIEGVNRNVLWSDPSKVTPKRLALMRSVFGDDSWIEAVYQRTPNLFDEELRTKIPGNQPIIAAYRERLRSVAGFAYVPEPIPMRNTRGAAVYYLFFASHNSTANRIVSQIFAKYRRLA